MFSSLQYPETFLPAIMTRLHKGEASVADDALLPTGSTGKIDRLKGLARVVLTRPLRMFLEPIVIFTDLFLLYQYAILYIYFEAYPIIFKGMIFISLRAPTCTGLS